MYSVNFSHFGTFVDDRSIILSKMDAMRNEMKKRIIARDMVLEILLTVIVSILLLLIAYITYHVV